MKQFITLFLLLMVGWLRVHGQYCTPSYTTGPTLGDSIVSLQLANLTGNYPTNASGYNNYTALTTVNLTAGQQYSITLVNNPSFASAVAFWIDYNQNLIFDTGEQIASTTLTAGAISTLSFIVPFATTPGATRLRMVHRRTTLPTLPCGSYNQGETEDYAVNITAPSNNDIALQGLVGFNTQDCAIYSSGIPISVKVANTGFSASGAIPLSYQIDNGPIQTGTQAALPSAVTDTFTFATLGVFPLPNTFYTLKIWHGSTPDQNPVNDTLTLTLLTPIVAPVPFFEDFETFTTGSPGSLNNGWTRINPSNTVGWLPDVAGTPSTTTGPSNDHSPSGPGVYMFTEVSGGTLGQQYKLFTPCISLSGLTTPRLSFWYHMAGVDIGTLEVRVIAAGVNTLAWSLSGPQQALETSPWLEGIVDISAYAGQTIQLEFRGICGPSFNGDIGLDDVSIFEPAAVDAGAVAIVSPTAASCYSATSTVTVQVRNLGTQTLDFSVNPLSVKVNTSGAAVQSVTSPAVSSGTLAPLATLNVDVPNVNLSAVGTYSFQALTLVTGDPNAFNDSTLGAVQTVPTQSGAFLETFESGVAGNGSSNPGTLPTGWTRTFNSTTTNPYTWFEHTGLTSSTNTGPTGNHTQGGSKYLYTEGNNGATGDVARLLSPCINLASLTSPKLRFFYHMFGTGIGSLNVDVIAAGVTTNIWTLSGAQQTAESAPYNEVILDLAPYAGQTVQLVFRAIKGTTTLGDIAVDDIQVYEPSTLDMSAFAIVNPGDGCFSAAQSVTVKALNYGSQPINFSTNPMTVTINVSGTATQSVSATVNTGTLAVLDTLNVVVSNLNLATPGPYQLKAFSTVAGDLNTFNDTTQANLNSLPVLPGATFLEDFEGFTAGTGTNTSPGVLENGWTRTTSNLMQWLVFAGSTSSLNTGPTADNTVNGVNYMYTESSSGVLGDVSRLITPCIDLAGMTAPKLEFYYHMNGAAMGTLAVDIKANNGVITNIWSLTGQQQALETSPWLPAIVDISAYAGQTIQVIFRGIRGSSFDSDMAIDDIRIFEPVST
ncbi:MAG: hypothetical protein EAZ89_05355, partial [Bacteroidetes bacterium]